MGDTKGIKKRKTKGAGVLTDTEMKEQSGDAGKDDRRRQ